MIFEERHGFDATLKRAELYDRYVDLDAKNASGCNKSVVLEAAQNAAGILSVHDLEVERKAVWQHLKQRNAVTD